MIIIHAAGNKEIGIGNLVRSYSLAVELKIEFKNEIIVIFECNEEVLKLINSKNIDISRFDNRKEVLEYLNMLKVNKGKNVYISDLLDINKSFENLIRDIGFNKLIHLNDSCLDNFKPDVLIDGDAFKKHWNLDSVEILQSPKFHIIKDEIVRKKPDKSWRKEKVREVLVCFGGSDPAYYTEKLLKELSEKDTYIKFKIIIGPEFSEDRVKFITSIKLKNVSYYRNVSNICELILESDMVLTLGGGVTYEAMCLGVAPVAVGWKYLNYYVDMLDSVNVIKKISGECMLEELLVLANNIKLVNEIAYNGWNMIDGKASKRIVNYIKKYMR